MATRTVTTQAELDQPAPTTRSARPVAMHDTTELERHQRGQRRAAWYVGIVCFITLAYVATHARLIVAAVLL